MAAGREAASSKAGSGDRTVHELAATSRASAELSVVAQAAGNEPAIVALGADERYTDCEQIDTAAVATLNNNGQVYATSETVVPGSEVAAIFRY